MGERGKEEKREDERRKERRWSDLYEEQLPIRNFVDLVSALAQEKCSGLCSGSKEVHWSVLWFEKSALVQISNQSTCPPDTYSLFFFLSDLVRNK
jgi:hypothetical protein